MKIKIARVVCLTFLLSFIITIVSSNLVMAQNANDAKESITLSPAINRPLADAGKVLNGKLTVINDGETEYQFLVYARPFSVKSESYDPDYTEVNERTEAYQWVQFEKTNLTLAAGARIEIPYTVTIPEKAKSGGHYAVLFAETQPPQSEGTQVARKKRVGSLLYITVNGELINSGSLASWDVDLWQRRSPAASALRIKNDGNVHFQVNSKVRYSNIFNKSRFELNQEHVVLPGTTRRIDAEFKNSPSIGIYRVSGSAAFLDKTEQLETKWIILLPIPMLAAGVLAILGLLGWYVAWPRLKARRKNNTAARRDDS